MYINTVEDLTLYKNCVNFERRDEGIVPLRFTDQQMAEYGQKEGFRLRSYAPASVTIDVLTDATHLQFDFIVDGVVRAYGFIDIWIDGQEHESYWFQPVERQKHLLNIPLNTTPLNPGNGSKRRVTLYLPHSTGMVITGMTWTGATIVEPAPSYHKNLLCLGDSITQGITALHPLNLYPTLLSSQLQMNVLNHGIGGYVFEAASLDEKLPFAPDCITVAYGTNDWGGVSELQQFSAKASAYFAKLNEIYPGVPTYVITPLWRKDIAQPKNMGTFEDMVATIEQACGSWSNMKLIRGTELIPPSEFFFSDGVHPTDIGFQYLVRKLLEQMAV